MKFLLTFLASLLGISAFGQAPVLRTPFSTNTAVVVTNIVRNTATNSSIHAGKLVPGGTLPALNGLALTNLDYVARSGSSIVSNGWNVMDDDLWTAFQIAHGSILVAATNFNVSNDGGSSSHFQVRNGGASSPLFTGNGAGLTNIPSSALQAGTLSTNYVMEFWGAVRLDGFPGDGSLWNPFDLSTQIKFDAIWPEALPTNSVLNLQPGIYQTTGSGASAVSADLMKSDQVLRGAGINQVALQIVYATNAAESGYAVIRAGDNSPGARIENLTIDCAPDGVMVTNVCVSGIVLEGSGCRVSNVRVIHWGSRVPSAESFGIIMNSVQAGPQTNNAVENCVIENGITNGTGGATLIAVIGWNTNFPGLPNHEQYGGIVRNNYVDGGSYRVQMYCNGIGAGSNPGIVEGNLIFNTTAGVYNDTVPFHTMVVRNNYFRNNTRGVDMPFATGGSAGLTNQLWDTLIIEGNVFEIGPGPTDGPSWGVSVRGLAGATNAGAVIIKDNVFQHVDASTNTVVEDNIAFATYVVNVHQMQVSDNTSKLPQLAAGHWPYEFGNVTRSYAFLNRTFDGIRVPASNIITGELIDEMPTTATSAGGWSYDAVATTYTNAYGLWIDSAGNLKGINSAYITLGSVNAQTGFAADDYDDLSNQNRTEGGSIVITRSESQGRLGLNSPNGASSINLSNSGIITIEGTIQGTGTDGGYLDMQNSGGSTTIVLNAESGEISATLFTGSGAGLTNVDGVKTYTNISELMQYGDTNQLAYITGYWGTNQWGKGKLAWEPGTAATNLGTVFSSSLGGRWRRQVEDQSVYYLEWFGVYPIDINDASTIHSSRREFTNLYSIIPDVPSTIIMPSFITAYDTAPGETNAIVIRDRTGLTIKSAEQSYGVPLSFPYVGPVMAYIGVTNGTLINIINSSFITLDGLGLSCDTPTSGVKTNFAQTAVEIDQDDSAGHTYITTGITIKNCRITTVSTNAANWTGIYLARTGPNNCENMRFLNNNVNSGGNEDPSTNNGTAIHLGPSANTFDINIEDNWFTHACTYVWAENGAYRVRRGLGNGAVVAFRFEGWCDPIALEDFRSEQDQRFLQLGFRDSSGGGGLAPVFVARNYIHTGVAENGTNGTIYVGTTCKLTMQNNRWLIDAGGTIKHYEVDPLFSPEILSIGNTYASLSVSNDFIKFISGTSIGEGYNSLGAIVTWGAGGDLLSTYDRYGGRTNLSVIKMLNTTAGQHTIQISPQDGTAAIGDWLWFTNRSIKFSYDATHFLDITQDSGGRVTLNPNATLSGSSISLLVKPSAVGGVGGYYPFAVQDENGANRLSVYNDGTVLAPVFNTSSGQINSTANASFTFNSAFGSGAGPAYVFDSTSVHTTAFKFMNGGSNLVTVLGSGNVGIGTTAPQNPLHVETSTVNSFPLRISGDTDVNGQWSGIQFGLSGFPTQYAKAAIIVRGTSGSVQPEMHFLVNGTADASNADTNDARMTILPTGNVGIGTVSPGAKLEVVGDIRASSTVIATNGFAGYRSNLLAAATITVGASPASWTNTLSPACSVQVFVDSSLGATTVGFNGSTIFGSFAGTQTVGLQPGAYITLTYVAVAPTATFTPFP